MEKRTHSNGPGAARSLAVLLFEQALATLKHLENGLARREIASARVDLISSLKEQAHMMGLELELRVVGSADRLAPSLSEVLWLTGREALLNLRRHAGTRLCRIEINLASSSFSLRARDWGGGLEATPDGGHGLALITELAAWLGCEVTVTSQPGLGTELAVIGPRCHCHAAPAPPWRRL